MWSWKRDTRYTPSVVADTESRVGEKAGCSCVPSLLSPLLPSPSRAIILIESLVAEMNLRFTDNSLYQFIVAALRTTRVNLENRAERRAARGWSCDANRCRLQIKIRPRAVSSSPSHTQKGYTYSILENLNSNPAKCTERRVGHTYIYTCLMRIYYRCRIIYI